MADPVEPKLRPIVLDARTRRDLIRDKTAEGLAGLFPLIGRDHELHVEDVRAKPLVYSSNDQKSAILHGRSLVEPIVGNLVLKDKLTGAVVDTKKNHILAHLPYFTERHTMIVGGNEYELPNQLRLKPGIYTRERDNGEFEASFNLSKGMNFRLAMEPETGKLHAEFGSTTVPLYQMLKALGVPDADIRQAWGTELLQSNAARKTAGSEEALLNKLIMKVKRSSEAMPQTIEAKKEYLHKYFKGTSMDASVSERTLGKAFDHASPMAMLEASKKLIGVHRGDREGDDRDSLEFKTLHSVDDFFKERLEKDAKKTIGSKLTWKMNQSKSKQIKDFVPNSTFTRSLTGFLTTSTIAGMPTQISPMEIIDHASKITSLGEGGITNDRAIPMESRKVHATHYGILDPVRTTECYSSDTEVFTEAGWKPWPEVTYKDKFACRVGEALEFHPAEYLYAAPYVGMMYGVKTAHTEYLVTPNHRVYHSAIRAGGAWRTLTAENRHGVSMLVTARHTPAQGSGHTHFRLPGITIPRTLQGVTKTWKTYPDLDIPMDDWLEFLGWYLAEGHYEAQDKPARYRVCIAQSRTANPGKCARIEALLSRMPFHWKNERGLSYVICSKQLALYLKKFGRSEDKFLPEYVYSASPAARNLLLEALLLGDGYMKPGATEGKYNTLSYSTCSAALAEGIVRLAGTLGLPVRMRSRPGTLAHHMRMYLLSFSQHTALQVHPRHHFTQQYVGQVYCATVPGGLLYVRRGGSLPLWSGNSFKAGIDIRAAMGAYRDDAGNMYARMVDARTGKVAPVAVTTLARSTVGFSNQAHRTGNVDALRGADVISVKRKEVDYYLEDPTHQFTPAVALVPMLNTAQGNRTLMSAKYQTQAMPLVDRDVPYIQSQAPRSSQSMEREVARLIVPTSAVHGTVERVDKDYIYIRPDTQKRAADTDFEAAASVYVDHIQKQLQQLPNAPRAVFYVQPGVDAQSLPTIALETHFVLPSGHSAHTHGEYKGQRPTSFLNPALPRGFTTVLKQRGDSVVPKIDWTFLDPAARGQGLASAYYRGIEQAARQLGHPELQVDASEGGLAYWARPEFGLTTAPAAARARAAVAGGSIIYRKHLQPETLKVADYDGCDDAYIPEDLLVKTAAPRTEPDSDGLIRVPYDTMFPLASKTHLHNDVTVKAGDKVTPGQQLAGSNFTRDGHIALGKNLSVGYMAYYGKNSNDAIVISEGAAKKLTSENMYKETLRKSGDTIVSKDKYKAYYGTRFTGAQLDKLDENGVAKPGVKIEPGDPLILALEKAAVSPDTAMLGHLHKSLVKPYRDATVTWDHQSPAEVVDAVQAARQIVVTAKTLEPMRLGDKLANRFGGKGVVADIIPDHQMVQDEKGKPIDILFTSAGVVSRINPGQIVESALGKVVEKTGTPYVLAQFQRGNMVDFARKELEKHDLKDKETVYDPISGKYIPKVFVGRSYIHRLFKDSDTNFAARGVTSYDVNQQPTKGGDVGAKGLGKMEINTLLAHNARNVLQESLTTKSERSDAYWRALEFGLPPPPPKTPFVTEKFSAMLKGSGINVDKSGTSVSLHALTDAHVTKLSSGALTLPTLEKSTSFMVTAKDLKPEKGGLFDPVLTGGLSGTRWAHIELPEPTISPVFEDATRRLLGLTKGGLREALATKGGHGVAKDLNAIDLGRKEAELIAKTKKARGADLDDAVKQLKYVRALKDHGFAKAGDAYITSKIAVIPPVMRPILPSQKSGELQVSDSNYLYRDMALAAAGLKAAQGVGLPGLTSEARTHMYDAVAALAGVGEPVSPQLQGRGVKGFLSQISGQTSPKQGFLFKKVLKRQQDLSGRATATPDTTLDMDQIGVPEDMLWTTYEKFIMKGLIAQGFPAPRAVEMIKEKHPAAKKVLDMELAQRPVFVNRAPSLHKHNFVAAYPVAIPGKSLRVNPFMEKGMNLDYDGDTMQLHVPVSNKAMAEAQQLTLKQLLFGDKSRDNLMVFPDHESIIGAYLATMGKATGTKKKFKDKAEAMAAYKRGEISLETPVEIG